MEQLTVIFNHGRESGPWGKKIRVLAKVAERLGCRVVSRDDTDSLDAELRVARLIAEAGSIEGSVVLVGSSMGGYVATLASRTVKPVGLFLMAPAFGVPGYEVETPRPTCRELTIVHGWGDDIVPLDAVLDFARSHQAMLHLVPAGHALLEQVDWLTDVFGQFLNRCLSRQTESITGRLLATL